MVGSGKAIARFLSLLDVVLLLLGYFVIAARHQTAETLTRVVRAELAGEPLEQVPTGRKLAEITRVFGLEFVILYAGWGERAGQVYHVIDGDWNRPDYGRAVQSVRDLGTEDAGRTIILLVFDPNGWYSDGRWTDTRLAELRNRLAPSLVVNVYPR